MNKEPSDHGEFAIFSRSLFEQVQKTSLKCRWHIRKWIHLHPTRVERPCLRVCWRSPFFWSSSPSSRGDCCCCSEDTRRVDTDTNSFGSCSGHRLRADSVALKTRWLLRTLFFYRMLRCPLQIKEPINRMELDHSEGKEFSSSNRFCFCSLQIF